jgi:hypothetical protein
MLRISRTTLTAEQPVSLRLEGQVTGRWVEELRGACDQLLDKTGLRGNRLVLDLAEVSFIDADGIALFRELSALRVIVTNCSPFVTEQLKGVADVDQ